MHVRCCSIARCHGKRTPGSAARLSSEVILRQATPEHPSSGPSAGLANEEKNALKHTRAPTVSHTPTILMGTWDAVNLSFLLFSWYHAVS